MKAFKENGASPVPGSLEYGGVGYSCPHHMCHGFLPNPMGILNTTSGFPIEGGMTHSKPTLSRSLRNREEISALDMSTNEELEPINFRWSSNEKTAAEEKNRNPTGSMGLVFLPTFGWYGWWVEVGSLTHYLLGFSTIPGGAGFLPSTVCVVNVNVGEYTCTWILWVWLVWGLTRRITPLKINMYTNKNDGLENVSLFKHSYFWCLCQFLCVCAGIWYINRSIEWLFHIASDIDPIGIIPAL